MKKLCALLIVLLCLTGCTQPPEESPAPTPEATAMPTEAPTEMPVSAEEQKLYVQLNELMEAIPAEPMDTSRFPKKVLVKQKKGTTLYLDEALTDCGNYGIYLGNALFSAYEIRKGVYKLQSDMAYRRDEDGKTRYFIHYGRAEDFELVKNPIDFYKYHENFKKHTYTIGGKTFEQAFLMETKLTLRDGSYIRCAQFSEDKDAYLTLQAVLYYYGADGNLISVLPTRLYTRQRFDFCMQTDLNRDGLPDLILLASSYALDPREGYENPFLSGDKVFEVNQMEQLEKIWTREGVQAHLANDARGCGSCIYLSDASDGSYSYYGGIGAMPEDYQNGYVPFASEVNKVTAELFGGAEKSNTLP